MMMMMMMMITMTMLICLGLFQHYLRHRDNKRMIMKGSVNETPYIRTLEFRLHWDSSLEFRDPLTVHA